jgi:polyferredoxin
VRVLVYTAILTAIAVAAGASLWMRVPVKMDVMADRGSMARELDDDRVENVYRLQIMNTQEHSQRLALGVASATLQNVELIAAALPIELPPLATRVVSVRVRARPVGTGSQPLEFTLSAFEGGPKPFTIREKSRFPVPRRKDHDR